jgi:hypothetical protein
MKRRTLVFSVLASLALLLALVPGGVMAQTKSPTIVVFAPEWQFLSSGGTTTVDVYVTNASNFYGVQFEFQFDTTRLEGLTVTEGAAFTGVAPDYIVTQHTFSGDRALFAASLVGVAPLNGDLHLATIEFRGKATGIAELQWVNVILANSSGAAMPHVTRDGTIAVTDQIDIVGYAFMQGRTDHTDIKVEASGPPLFYADALTDADGRYEIIDALAGEYVLLMEHDLYLAASLENCDTGVGSVFNPPPVTLLGGDLNADQVINIMDLTRCASVFGSADPGADINADGVVNLLDLVLIGINFGETGPTVQFCP